MYIICTLDVHLKGFLYQKVCLFDMQLGPSINTNL